MDNIAYFRALYELSGLTQKEIADYLNVSVRSVERWCTRLNPPSGVVLEMEALEERIADFVDSKLEELTDVFEETGDSLTVLIQAYRDQEEFSQSDYWEGLGFTLGTQWEIVKRLYCELQMMDYRARIVPADPESPCLMVALCSVDESEELESFTV